MTMLAPHLANFLRAHLPRERNASPHTIAAYAHSFTLLVRSAAERLKKRPSDLAVEDIESDLVLAFLDHIEASRANLAATGDIWKVALWLGHASINSTEAYLRTDPDEKLAVLAAHAPPTIRAGKFRPPSDPLLATLGEVRSIT